MKQSVPGPLMLAILLFTLNAGAANLKPETVAAWDSYLETAKSDLQKRIRPSGTFLWTFENPDRLARVRSGEIVVAPVPGASPRKIPGGLIHHWIGAVFVPDLKLEQALEVTRDYDRYRNYYRPVVIESKTVARSEESDRFSIRMMNKAFFLKTAFDADYQATTVRLDEHRIYSVSQTTRVQEIEQFGEPGQHSLPEGEGGGYLWKMFSIARYEQRDSGVYFEFEAVALSRDIPAAARLFVDPIVRRISRNSLSISLRQTEQALRENLAVASKRTTAPAGSGRAQTGSGSY